MKFLTPDPVLDEANLVALAANPLLSSYPHLQGQQAEIIARYQQYHTAAGNSWSEQAPSPLGLNAILKQALGQHFDSPPQSLGFIEGYRDKGSPRVCPMCGGQGSGQLDHVFPRSFYPEFSVYSRNLVPSCKCNNKRQNNYRGVNHGERVLHPYYDQILNTPLLRANFSNAMPRPAIGLEVIIPLNDPHYLAVTYHMNEVVLKSPIISSLEKLWLDIHRDHEAFLDELPEGVLTIPVLTASVTTSLNRETRRRQTPNNWDSIFYSGLLNSPNVLAWLCDRLNGIRAGAIDPLSI